MKNIKLFEEYSSGYPTLEEVESASPNQIMSWQRFLPSPSNKTESEIINRVYDRYLELKKDGNIDSSTSKSVGW